MLSKARIGSHPLHPMLIAVPITCYLATFAALIGLAATKDPFWFRLALWGNIIGVISAVVAAIPGTVDFLGLVPGRTVARRSGYAHALANVSALILFAINLYLMARAYGNQEVYHRTSGIILTGAGVLITFIAGWFGWEMVQRHHLGVIEQAPSRAINDPNALAAHLGRESQTVPVTDSQVMEEEQEQATTSRWPRDGGEGGRITRH
jgi:uncharacterized membrane protein